MTPTEQALHQLKMLAVSGARISWEVPHAKVRALEREVPIFVAERIVRAAAALRLTKAKDGSTTWRVSGVDADLRPIDVVVLPAPNNVLRVITVIRTDQ